MKKSIEKIGSKAAHQEKTNPKKKRQYTYRHRPKSGDIGGGVGSGRDSEDEESSDGFQQIPTGPRRHKKIVITHQHVVSNPLQPTSSSITNQLLPQMFQQTSSTMSNNTIEPLANNLSHISHFEPEPHQFNMGYHNHDYPSNPDRVHNDALVFDHELTQNSLSSSNYTKDSVQETNTTQKKIEILEKKEKLLTKMIQLHKEGSEQHGKYLAELDKVVQIQLELLSKLTNDFDEA
jgi:hypothetical protein